MEIGSYFTFQGDAHTADQRERFNHDFKIEAIKLSDVDIKLINKILNLSPAERLTLHKGITQS